MTTEGNLDIVFGGLLWNNFKAILMSFLYMYRQKTANFTFSNFTGIINRLVLPEPVEQA